MAAEIPGYRVAGRGWPAGASMRPRRMAAEIGEGGGGDLRAEGASMRPRRMAAEISTCRRITSGPSIGFNEAAANGRGNLVARAGRLPPLARASMRPRRMAAEIIHKSILKFAPEVASMRPRRMAAEIQGRPGQPPRPALASMRPRRMAAEIGAEVLHTRAGSPRFNEAAANGRGNRGAGGGYLPRVPALQ